MFEKGWVRAGEVLGPVPAAPCAWWTADDLLRWAPRAPLTGAWLDAVAALEAGELPARCRVDLTVAWERIRRGVEAGFLASAGSIAVRPCRPDPGDLGCEGSRCGHDWSVEDAATALHLGPISARTLLGDARELTDRLPETLAELGDGTIPAANARRLAAATSPLTAAEAARLQAWCLPTARSVTPSMFVTTVTAATERLQTSGELLAAHDRAARGQTGITRGLSVGDGMGCAIITAPDPQIASLLAWARGFTRYNREGGDPRTVGQRRVDALVDHLITGGVSAPPPSAPAPPQGAAPPQTAPPQAASPESGPSQSAPPQTALPQAAAPPESAGGGAGGGTEGRRGGADAHAADGHAAMRSGDTADSQAPTLSGRVPVHLRLVMDLATVCGTAQTPGWLDGYGPISAPLARRLAIAPATIQRLVTDPLTGGLIDLGRTRRLPTPAQAERIRARDGTCTFPTCSRGADCGEIDHLVPWRHGGRTDSSNLHPPCPRHHRARHAAGWTPVRHADGTTTWTDRDGRSYRTFRLPWQQSQAPEPPPQQPPPSPSAPPSPPGSAPPSAPLSAPPSRSMSATPSPSPSTPTPRAQVDASGRGPVCDGDEAPCTCVPDCDEYDPLERDAEAVAQAEAKALRLRKAAEEEPPF